MLTKIPISSIIFEEDIYPRSGVSLKRVSMFAENIRDGFEMAPIEVGGCQGSCHLNMHFFILLV